MCFFLYLDKDITMRHYSRSSFGFKIPDQTKKYSWCVFIGLLLTALVVWLIFHQIKEQYLQDDPMLRKLKKICLPLHPDVKNLKLYKGDKSYTINKEKIYLCLFDEKGEYYNTNMLVFVLIHEFSHWLNKEDIGHTEKFHKIFEELLAKATELEIYNPSLPIIDNYCTYND